jgi:hypothetical protein
MKSMALSANEIRVGNYLRLSGNTSREAPIESIQLSDSGYSFYIGGALRPHQSVEGVTLTASWFYQCGFMEIADNEFVSTLVPHATFLLDGPEIKVILNDVQITKIRYLHELQNLVHALSGVDLRIEPRQ